MASVSPLLNPGCNVNADPFPRNCVHTGNPLGKNKVPRTSAPFKRVDLFSDVHTLAPRNASQKGPPHQNFKNALYIRQHMKPPRSLAIKKRSM